MNQVIKIGLPSKGRLKEDSLKIFRRNKLFVKDTNRNYLSEIKNFSSNEIIFSHAREIIERLSDNSIDIGISGYDLLKESLPGIQKNIQINSKLNFGFANLVVAVPDAWIDVQTIADLEEISFELKDRNTGKLRVASKYPNLTNDFLQSKGLTQYKIVNSLGSTEIYPFTNQSEIITDITSTGSTLKANKLRILKDGYILRSSACILVSKKSFRDKYKKTVIKKLLNKIKKTPETFIPRV
jgi:ATP phosphoribosyltransferase